MTGEIHEKDWAIFCRVIDNHGDVGVCWRLATQLAQQGLKTHLYIDDASALQWMAPQGDDRVRVLPWPSPQAVFSPAQVPGVVIEAFGCELPLGYQAAMAAKPTAPVWVNLEYFSLEASAQRNHGLPSPVLSGPARGLVKWFYYPGWGEHSGGLLTGWTQAAAAQRGRSGTQPFQISVFCYEPPSLAGWLNQLSRFPQPVHLQVTAGRASAAVQQALPSVDASGLTVNYLNHLSQADYDALLARMDLNLVRGEDSLVRAMCAGKPLLWQIYPQHDGAHWPKLQAFLQQTQAPLRVVQAHEAWNADHPCELPALSEALLHEWRAWAQQLQRQLAQQTGLAERLVGFVTAKG